MPNTKTKKIAKVYEPAAEPVRCRACNAASGAMGAPSWPEKDLCSYCAEPPRAESRTGVPAKNLKKALAALASNPQPFDDLLTARAKLEEARDALSKLLESRKAGGEIADGVIDEAYRDEERAGEEERVSGHVLAGALARELENARCGLLVGPGR